MSAKVTDKELSLAEQAAFAATVPGNGQFGVLAETPNAAAFQSDDGVIHRLHSALGTVVDTSTGLPSYTITGIPAGCQRIEMMYSGVSGDGTNNFTFEIGAVGGIETTGYLSRCSALNSTPSILYSNSTTDFIVFKNPTSSGEYTGLVTLVLMNAATNKWIMAANIIREDGNSQSLATGSKTLSGVLTQLKLTLDGSNNYDGGEVNIQFS